VYAATLIASAVRGLVYWRTLGLRPSWPANVHLVARLLRAGWPIALLALLGLVRLHADRLLAARLLGASAAGELQAALVVAFGVTEFIGATLLLVGLPAMARTWAEGRHEAFWALGDRMAAVGIVLAFPVAVAATLMGEWFVGLAFGPAYGATAAPLALFLWAAVVGMATGVVSQALLCQHRQRALLVARAGLVTMHVLLLAVLLPRAGVAGAGWASLATELVTLVVLLLVVAPSRWPAGRRR
jgi:O-antigen/teichoic acid export membrane protein